VSARIWFTLANTGMQDLHRIDLQILNRAARSIWAPGFEPRSSDLIALRMQYKSGMSAADLLAAVEGMLP